MSANWKWLNEKGRLVCAVFGFAYEQLWTMRMMMMIIQSTTQQAHT